MQLNCKEGMVPKERSLGPSDQSDTPQTPQDEAPKA